MSTENKNMPRLRFPSFTGEWVEKKLGEICNLITPPLRLHANYYLLTGKYPIVDQSQSLICGWTNDDTGLITNHPVIIFGDHTCVLKYIDFSFVQGADGVKILSPQKDYNSRFVYYSFLSNPVKQDGYKRHYSDFREKDYHFSSSLAEQQKIAECLTAIDDLIVAQGKKVDALKEHKKGLMQQLFPQQGETTPRLRFPGFTGEWVEKKLGEVSERVSVGLATSVTPYYRDKGVVMFRNLNIKPGFLDDTDILYLDETFADENPSKKIHTDDVLTVHTGYVGISCVVPQKYEGALTFTTLVTTTKKQILNPQFLCCYLNSTEGAKEIQILQAGGGRNNLNVNDFILFRIPLPPTLAEQQKIAECLSTLDDQIKAETAELDALKEHKKGLMQQLFPQPTK